MITTSPNAASAPGAAAAAADADDVGGSLRIGYVVKRYPRFSETFIVNEILAHEAAGATVEIFALRPGCDTHFQPAIATVRAPVRYLRSEGVKAETLWRELVECAVQSSEGASLLAAAGGATAIEACQAIELAQRVQLQKIDHLHAHFGTSAATVARLAARLSGVRYTFTAHAKDIFHESVDASQLALKIADAATVVTVSDFNQQYLAQRYPQPPGRVRRIYNGLDLEQYPFASPQQRPRQIVAVGRLVEKKGFDDLLTACSLLSKAHVDYRCVIVGGGDQESALRQQVQRLGIDDRVELRGPLPQNEVFRTVQQSALLAAPCVTASTGDQDGLPTVLLEAMALGTPCVGTDVTGVPEAIQQGQTGLIVPQRSPAQLAAALHKLLDDAPLRVAFAAASRRRVERLFNVHRSAAELRRVFAQAACRPLSAQENP